MENYMYRVRVISMRGIVFLLVLPFVVSFVLFGGFFSLGQAISGVVAEEVGEVSSATLVTALHEGRVEEAALKPLRIPSQSELVSQPLSSTTTPDGTSIVLQLQGNQLVPTLGAVVNPPTSQFVYEIGQRSNLDLIRWMCGHYHSDSPCTEGKGEVHLSFAGLPSEFWLSVRQGEYHHFHGTVPAGVPAMSFEIEAVEGLNTFEISMYTAHHEYGGELIYSQLDAWVQ